MLLPNWCYFNIYEMSSWDRAGIRDSHGCAVLAAARLAFARAARAVSMNCSRTPTRKTAAFDWSKATYLLEKTFFLALDRGLKLYEKIALEAAAPSGALREAKSWMLKPPRADRRTGRHLPGNE